MASTLVCGKYIICSVTGTDSAEVVYDGAVFQRDGEIIDIGRYEDLRTRYNAEEVIGSPDYVVMPGLINSHFHVGLTPFQLGQADMPLELWLASKMGTRDVDPYLSHLYGAVQMIQSGTTTVQVIPGIIVQVMPGASAPVDLDATEKILKAYQDSGMRVSYGAAIRNQNYLVSGIEGGEENFTAQLPVDLAKRFESFMRKSYLPTEEHIAHVEAICSKYADNSNNRIRVMVSPSNVHRCSDDLLLALKQVAQKHKVNIHLHLQETIYQKLYGLHAWGKTPLQHLQDLGFLGNEVTCAHSVWVTDEDIEVMAATGTNVCHLLSSNLRMQSGIAPVNRFLEAGVRVTLGTDEATINDDKDMFQEMRLALKLHRVPGIENKPPTAYQIFQMATMNGSYDCGFGDCIGALKPGKRADMVLVNLKNIEEPYLDPDVSIVDAIVQRGRSIDVDTVIIDGEVVLRGGRLTRVDSEALFRELKESLNRPLLPHEIERRELSRLILPYLRRFYAGTMDRISPVHYYYNSRS